MPDPAHPFWGDCTTDGPWTGRLGPMELWLDVRPGEVEIAAWQNEDALDTRLGPASTPEPPHDARRARFAVPLDGLALAPALADRPVVVRPEVPVHLPPGSSITLLISTPLWVQLVAGTPPVSVFEGPSFRPSDTWFGPSPREGLLCYSSRTRARLLSTASPTSPARASTELTLNNFGADTLVVVRLSLPAPRLALYAEPGSAEHWSESVTFTRQANDHLAEVQIQRGPPASAPGGIQVAPPREIDPQNVFRRALSSLVG